MCPQLREYYLEVSSKMIPRSANRSTASSLLPRITWDPKSSVSPTWTVLTFASGFAPSLPLAKRGAFSAVGMQASHRVPTELYCSSPFRALKLQSCCSRILLLLHPIFGRGTLTNECEALDAYTVGTFSITQNPLGQRFLIIQFIYVKYFSTVS